MIFEEFVAWYFGWLARGSKFLAQELDENATGPEFGISESDKDEWRAEGERKTQDMFGMTVEELRQKIVRGELF